MQATPDRLRALLWDLADDDRILLECRIVDAWGYADIAVHLGVPRDVLADRVHRLRTDLRRGAKALGGRARRRRTGRDVRVALLRRQSWLERRRSRQSALRQVPWPLDCRATGRALSASCAWWRFLRLRQHTGAWYGSRPRHRRQRVSGDLPTNKTPGAGCGAHVAAVAAFSVCQQLRQRRAAPPRLAGRSRQTAALAAAAFE